jgi:hypothetical protein
MGSSGIGGASVGKDYTLVVSEGGLASVMEALQLEDDVLSPSYCWIHLLLVINRKSISSSDSFCHSFHLFCGGAGSVVLSWLAVGVSFTV